MTSKSILAYKAMSPTNLKRKKNNWILKTNLGFWLHRVYFHFSARNEINEYWFLNLHIMINRGAISLSTNIPWQLQCFELKPLIQYYQHRHLGRPIPSLFLKRIRRTLMYVSTPTYILHWNFPCLFTSYHSTSYLVSGIGLLFV